MRRGLFLIWLLVLPSVLFAEELPEPSLRTLRVKYRIVQKILNEQGKVVMKTDGDEVRTVDAVEGKYRLDTVTRRLMGQYKSEQRQTQIFDGQRMIFLNEEIPVATYIDNMPIPKQLVWQMAVGSMVIGEESGTESEMVLGRSCMVLESRRAGLLEQKEWVWNGVVLKREVHTTNTEEFLEAVEIEENPSVDPAWFEIPLGYEVVSMEESMAGSIEQHYGTLEDPDEDSEFLIRDLNEAEQGQVRSKDGTIDLDKLIDLSKEKVERAREKVERARESAGQME